MSKLVPKAMTALCAHIVKAETVRGDAVACKAWCDEFDQWVEHNVGLVGLALVLASASLSATTSNSEADKGNAAVTSRLESLDGLLRNGA